MTDSCFSRGAASGRSTHQTLKQSQSFQAQTIRPNRSIGNISPQNSWKMSQEAQDHTLKRKAWDSNIQGIDLNLSLKITTPNYNDEFQMGALEGGSVDSSLSLSLASSSSSSSKLIRKHARTTSTLDLTL